MLKYVLLASGLLFSFAASAAAVSDYQFSIASSGFFPNYTWRLTSVSSPGVYGGPLTADNPTINLTVGKRYAVTNPEFGPHPFQVLAKAASFAGDVVLLAQGLTAGSMEANPAVAWSDNGAGVVEFTVTQGLLDAMKAGGKIPGYRCANHPDAMRGNFTIPTPVDFQFSVAVNGVFPNFTWRLTAVSTSSLTGDPLNTDNPTIILTIGKRYAVTNLSYAGHPFQVIAKAPAAAGDIVLLSQGLNAGTLETDADVNWNDNGAGTIAFTLTPTLAIALRPDGKVPGYRCGNHPDTMRGNFITLNLAGIAGRIWLGYR